MKNFELASHAIHLWIAHLESLENTSLLKDELLLQEEKQRLAQFVTPLLQKKFFYSHAILKLLLSKYLHQPPTAIRYRYGIHGKPFLNESLIFNMSHSNEHVAIVLCKSSNIGVDIEDSNRQLSITELIPLISNEEDKNRLLAIKSPEEQRAHFFRLWTTKEAFFKMLGIGIGDYLPWLSFDTNQNAFFPTNNSVITSKIHTIVNKKYIASIAYSGQNNAIISNTLTNVEDII